MTAMKPLMAVSVPLSIMMNAANPIQPVQPVASVGARGVVEGDCRPGPDMVASLGGVALMPRCHSRLSLGAGWAVETKGPGHQGTTQRWPTSIKPCPASDLSA